jgi:nicotinamide phosphoribosyltransferase
MNSNLFEITALSAVDTYKLGHVDQLPEGVQYIYSNFTPRFDKHFAGKNNKYYDGKVVVAGIRTMIEFINRLWNETFFKVPLEDVLDEYTDLVASFVTGKVTTNHIIALHDIGFLPVEIRALDEGRVVNTNIPVLTICNTVAGFGWVVGFLEDLISAENWKVSTNATTARLYRKIMEAYATKMGVPLWFVNYQGHDFSLRGLSGIVDGSNSGQGHLMYFEGTDNLPAVNRIRKIYGDSYVGCSVSATEHLVSSSNILTSGIEDKQEAEAAFFKRYITEIYPSGICSYVSDTYDYWGFIENVLPEFVDVINARGNDANGMSKVVVRPDSGDPVHVVAGYRITTPDRVYNMLSEGHSEVEKLPDVIVCNNDYFIIEYQLLLPC